jgi:hypothetical protein
LVRGGGGFLSLFCILLAVFALKAASGCAVYGLLIVSLLNDRLGWIFVGDILHTKAYFI